MSNKETHHQTTTRQRHSWCRSRNKNLLRKNQATQQHQEDLNLCNLALTRGFKGPFKRKPNNHSNSSLPFCNNHHAPQRTCHAWCRSRERKTTKERKNFFSFPLLSLQTLNRRHQDTLSLHLESTSNSKIFELVFCPWGRKRRRDERRKSFFEILILAAFFLLLLVHSLACLQTQSNSDFYFEREQMRADERRQEKEREWGFLYAGSIRKKENNQPPKTEANHNRKREQHRNKKDQQFTNHSTKTNNNISCLRKRITKRTAPACNSQNQPTKTSRLRDRTATQRKKKRGKEFFPFALRPQQQKPQSTAKRINRFFSRQQTTRSSSREPVAIALSPHQHHK